MPLLLLLGVQEPWVPLLLLVGVQEPWVPLLLLEIRYLNTQGFDFIFALNLPVYFSLFQPIPAYASLLLTHSSIFQKIPLNSKQGVSSKAFYFLA